ncbi:MinD/ParA family ATP-binding protein [Brachybacterium aquaticum]|uniref:MinD-like ATPase involved in chromosome partitioning or flagellar assembly n=1 Tax=Brachybacterium aquaticum TaxID=1432564 RepID=A0A841AHA9_9MICO|nr:chromosome partitioning protein [Brachybacterium aquaticum]MBB5832670.1 MinD-like ATPase involved in chromosome partitioning or flagellar assembly [Brachybacterium aquaticum]
MIAQARITSDTTATVHLADRSVEVVGADLPEIRDRIKDVFISSAKEQDRDIDVVIVEPDVRHHLQVEPTGRISARDADDRPMYGPDDDEPLLPAVTDPDSAASEACAVSAASAVSATSAASASAESTGELAAVRPHGGRRRRAAAPVADSAASSGSAVSAPSAAPAPSADAAPSSDAAAQPAPAPESRPLTPRTAPPADDRPRLQDLQTQTAKLTRVRATRGFPGFVTRLTGGRIAPAPGRAEQADIARLERIQRPLEGPRNIAVVNLKGGAHKTTASLMIAATLGVSRGGSVLAWDNNETRGTLGWRGLPTDHHRTAVDLLHGIDGLRAPGASTTDLDPYVRPQGEMRFDILASDEDPGSAALIDDTAFADLDEVLSRFYRLKVIDTGNNVRASNWLASVRSADQLVIVSTVREDTFNAAAWMIDELRATGLGEQVDHAVTILSHGSKGKFDATLRKRLLAHFGAHTRAVTEVPYEKQFADGTHLDWTRVSKPTKEAWLDATALIVDGL